MAKKYDVIVVGAGPAGFLAAKAAGENGLEVALLERRPDITRLTRACAQTLDSMNEYYFGDLAGYNARDKRIFFPVTGFSFKYNGPYGNIYACHFYTPNGRRIALGDPKEQRRKGDRGRVGIAFDKDDLFRCLLKEVKAYGVDVFSGMDVEKVTTTADGVIAKGSGKTFEGTYLIAADGVNSRVAQTMGFNEDRYYYCNLYVLLWYMSGVEPPDTDVAIVTHGFPKGLGALFMVIPRTTEGNYCILASTLDPRLDLGVAIDYFMKRESLAPWFKNVKKLKAFSAVCNCYSPIVEPYKNRVLVTGDAGSIQDLENTGAMISGWKAGQAVSTAVQEANLVLETTGISRYVKWWKEAFIDYYDHETYFKGFALPYILTTEEEIDYVYGLMSEYTLHPYWGPYPHQLGEALKKVIPTIKQERPELLRKLAKNKLPSSQILAEVTKISKPV